MNGPQKVLIFTFATALMGCSAKHASIHEAARAGDAKAVGAFIAQGVDVNETSGQGWTALHEASTFGHEEVLKVLLAKGVNKDLRTNSGISALEQAIFSNEFDCVKLLLDAGADHWTPGPHGRTVQEILTSLGKGALIPVRK